MGPDLFDNYLQNFPQSCFPNALSETIFIENEIHLVFSACDGTRIKKAELEPFFLNCLGAFSLMESDEKGFQISKNISRVLEPGGMLILTTPNTPITRANPRQGDIFDPISWREIFFLESINSEGKNKMLPSTPLYCSSDLIWVLTIASFLTSPLFASPGGQISIQKKAFF